MAEDGADPRKRLLGVLLDKVAQDLYPSNTMLDYIEEILEPDDVAAYAAVLLEKIADETYPSVSMMRRLVDLTQG
jgi:L-alanine-DL-glutamate epimerase-like enolase superfamily enzyme